MRDRGPTERFQGKRLFGAREDMWTVSKGGRISKIFGIVITDEVVGRVVQRAGQPSLTSVRRPRVE